VDFFFLNAFYFLECNDWYVTGVVMVCFWIVMFFGRFFFGLYSFFGKFVCDRCWTFGLCEVVYEHI
jgi:hypothetical protein